MRHWADIIYAWITFNDIPVLDDVFGLLFFYNILQYSNSASMFKRSRRWATDWFITKPENHLRLSPDYLIDVHASSAVATVHNVLTCQTSNTFITMLMKQKKTHKQKHIKFFRNSTHVVHVLKYLCGLPNVGQTSYKDSYIWTRNMHYAIVRYNAQVYYDFAALHKFCGIEKMSPSPTGGNIINSLLCGEAYSEHSWAFWPKW